MYGSTLLRSASLDATFTNDDTVHFSRNPTKLQSERYTVHTYSPVDIVKPNYTLHPLFRNTPSFNCTINPGEILFVPSHWWHEVTSYDDEYGKSIGVNYFFEPYYHRPGYLSNHPNMQFNRHYSHIADLKSVNVCSKKNICFKKSKKRQSKKKKSKKYGSNEL